MKYTMKEKLPNNDEKELQEKSSSMFSETQMIILLIITTIFTIMLMIECSIIFRYSDYSETETVITFDEISTAIAPSYGNLSLSDDQMTVVQFVKDYAKVTSQICTGTESALISSKCVEIISFRKGYHVFIPPQWEILGNKKFVFSLVWKKITTPEEIADGAIDLYVVDLNNLTHKLVMVRGPYDNETLKSYNPFEIIPYQNKFDIFIKSTAYCSPPGSICIIRYDDEGKWLNTLDFPFETKNNVFNLEKFYPLNNFNSTSGYAYISLQNSTVKLLNQYLEVTHEKIFKNGFISAHAVSNGSIGICTTTNSQTNLCYKLNSSLDVQNKYLLKNELNTYGLKLLNLEGGDSLAVSISKGIPLSVKVQRLASDGKISKPHIFTVKDCISFEDPFEEFFKLTGNYCFVFSCFGEPVDYCLNGSRLSI